MGHVAAGAPLTCGSTSELTNNVPHRPACRLHPQVGAAVSHKRGTTQNEVCAHDPSRVHSLWCIECFVFCLPCFAPQVLPLLCKGSPSSSRTCLTCIRLGQALSCPLLSRVVCCLVFAAVSHPLPPCTLCCLIPSAVSYPLLSRTLCCTCTDLTRSGPPAADTHRWVPLSSPPRGTTQTRCAHAPPHVHSLWCIECFVLSAHLALPRRFPPSFSRNEPPSPSPSPSSGPNALVSSAASHSLLPRTLCCLALSAVSHPLLPVVATLCLSLNFPLLGYHWLSLVALVPPIGIRARGPPPSMCIYLPSALGRAGPTFFFLLQFSGV